MATDHDPGTRVAGERGEAQVEAARHPIAVEGATVRIGTASWTDPTMVEPGVFYPPDATNAEERLRYYADQFPIAEVDATLLRPADPAAGRAVAGGPDAAGRYSLTVPADTYVILASDPAGATQRFWSDDPAVYQATPLSVERALAGIDMALVPATAIGGQVRSGPTEFTDAVAGSRVVAYLAGGTLCCRIVGVAITSEQGSFLMYVPPGLYRIEIDPPAGTPYAAEWWNGAATFATATEVTLGSEPIQLEVELAVVSP